MAGFAQLTTEHKRTLARLQHIFRDTPLSQSLTDAINAIYQSLYLPEHFRVLAAARVSLQGAQYHHLLNSVQLMLKRNPSSPVPDPIIPDNPPPPLLNGAAYWLMDIALQGFARLTPGEVTAFDSTLLQLQNDPTMLPVTAILNGVLQALVGSVPAEPETAPLFRWVDLWSHALILTAQQPSLPSHHETHGTLHLMGVEWRSQPRIISVVFYGILTEDEQAQWVRITCSAYKVNAIREEEAWLLLPQTQRLLHAMAAGETLQLEGMPLLPTGDLLWDDALATISAPYSLMDVAGRYLIPGADETIYCAPPLPEKRHPVHLAVPVAFEAYEIDDDDHVIVDDLRLPLDMRRVYNTELTRANLVKQQQMVALVRYDNQQFWLQPLATFNKMAGIRFIGSDLKIFEKPPKNNTVSVLQERASRLLREK